MFFPSLVGTNFLILGEISSSLVEGSFPCYVFSILTRITTSCYHSRFTLVFVLKNSTLHNLAVQRPARSRTLCQCAFRHPLSSAPSSGEYIRLRPSRIPAVRAFARCQSYFREFSGLFYCLIVNVLSCFSHKQLWHFITSPTACQALFYFIFSLLSALTDSFDSLSCLASFVKHFFYLFFRSFRFRLFIVDSLHILPFFSKSVNIFFDIFSTYFSTIQPCENSPPSAAVKQHKLRIRTYTI